MDPSMQFKSNTATTDNLETLADRVHALRPAWHPGSLLTKLRGLAATGVDYGQLHRAAIEAAQSPHIKTPAGIDFVLERLARAAHMPGGGKPCGVCGKPYDRCIIRPKARYQDDADDHEYSPRSGRLTPVPARHLSTSDRTA